MRAKIALIHNQQRLPVFRRAVVDGVVYVGCRDAQLYALDAATGKEKWKFDNALSWVITSPAVADGKVYFRHVRLQRSITWWMRRPASRSSKQEGKAYMFSSPAVADGVVFIGVLNGTLEARDLKTGDLTLGFPDRRVEGEQGLGSDRGAPLQSTVVLLR